MALRRQYGALPWFRGADGEVRVVLVTTRETRRWSVPRGNPMKGKKPHEAAAVEAYEEAGVRGRVGKRPVGRYDYVKAKGDVGVPTRVRVFPLRVAKRLASFPEWRERTVRDFSLADAAGVLADPGLADIVAGFVPKGAKRATTPAPADVPAPAPVDAVARACGKGSGKAQAGKAQAGKRAKASAGTPKGGRRKGPDAPRRKGKRPHAGGGAPAEART